HTRSYGDWSSDVCSSDLFLAGGGFKAGHIHGATDEVGYKAAVDRVSVLDLHATIVNQLGLDHQSLTFEHSGRDESLTDASLTGRSEERRVGKERRPRGGQ